jgi:hypothetical protein
VRRHFAIISHKMHVRSMHTACEAPKTLRLILPNLMNATLLDHDLLLYI